MAAVASVSSHSLKSAIDPRPGDHARAVAWADLVLVGLDQLIERGRIDVALLGQQRLERAHPQLDVAELGELAVIVVVMVVAHTSILDAACSHAESLAA